MSITDPKELAGLRAAGAVVRRMLNAMRDAVRVGITTAELDEVGANVMREQGAQSAPQMVYKFPGVNCISVNDEAVHGIPGDQVDALVLVVARLVEVAAGDKIRHIDLPHFLIV